MSGSRKGERRGGRKPGTPNRRTAEAVAKAEASGLMPLDYMLSVLRDESQSQEARFAAAEKAAPYLHPRLASVDAKLKADVDASVTFTWRAAQ